MAVTITRTARIDDDGTGTTGTVINNAEKTSLYNEIDAALAQLVPGTAGAITFPATQVPSSNPNVLDDYEEGVWTPAFQASSATYALQKGVYTKVGRMVVCHFRLQLSAKGTLAGLCVLNGLPFQAEAAATMPFFVGFANWQGTATPYVAMYLQIDTATNPGIAYFIGLPAAGTDSHAVTVDATALTNTTLFNGTLMYRAVN
jgi:hypothetical protein